MPKLLTRKARWRVYRTGIEDLPARSLGCCYQNPVIWSAAGLYIGLILRWMRELSKSGWNFVSPSSVLKSKPLASSCLIQELSFSTDFGVHETPRSSYKSKSAAEARLEVFSKDLSPCFHRCWGPRASEVARHEVFIEDLSSWNYPSPPYIYVPFKLGVTAWAWAILTSPYMYNVSLDPQIDAEYIPLPQRDSQTWLGMSLANTARRTNMTRIRFCRFLAVS